MGLKKFINNFSIAFGIIAGIFGFYSYFSTIKEREPIFIIEPVKVELVNSNGLSKYPIKILNTLDGREINKDLTLIRYYFWNDGHESIKANQVLRSLNITSTSKIKIIHCKILKASREVCDIKTTIVDSNKVYISFDILENLDGLTGEFLYEGPITAEFNLVGVIEGVKTISNEISGLKSWLLTGAVMLFVGLVSIIFGYILSKYKVPSSSKYVFSRTSNTYIKVRATFAERFWYMMGYIAAGIVFASVTIVLTNAFNPKKKPRIDVPSAIYTQSP